MPRRISAVSAVLMFMSLAAVLGGCGAPDKHYALRGRVIAKSSAAGQLSVDHEEIPGFMPAMTMPYRVKDPQGLAAVEPGDKITADVVVKGNDNYWLQHLTITDQSGRGSVSATTPHELLPGEAVPDIPLVNQDGKTLHLSQFRGKIVLLTFIYTRCPLPTFCPLISTHFAAIQRDLATNPADFDKTHLISISLDPKYDTAPILRNYGLSYLGDDPTGFAHWDFVATSLADLKRLATVFGLEYYEQDNQIAHSMNTILLARDGTVSRSWPGSEWKTSEVMAAVRQAAAN